MNKYLVNPSKVLKYIFILALISAVIFIARDMSPLRGDSFTFHDMTQFARVYEHTKEIKSLNILTKYARDMNFGLGYPIFAFYAPVAYYTSSIINLLGFGVIEAVDLSFFIFWLTGSVGIYFLVKISKKNNFAAITSAILYALSPWWASEIFVRGNLATSAFLAFAPWALWSTHSYKKYPKKSLFFIFLTTLSHNALSILFIPILFVYGYLISKIDRVARVKFLILSVLSTSWFWFPAYLQLSQTYAKEVATMINYRDHFLCVDQIWSGLWGYGASMKGCYDGMSFMLGKLQIVTFVIGILIALWRKKVRSQIYFELLIVTFLIFMTLPDSNGLWQAFPLIQAIQFPWRFLAMTLPFLALGSSHFFEFLSNKLHEFDKIYSFIITTKNLEYLILLMTLCAVVLGSSKFFVAQKLPKGEISNKYLSKTYISNSAAYEAPEYLPKSVDRNYWLKFRDQNIPDKDKIILKNKMDKFALNPYYQMLGILVSGLSIYFALCRHTHTKRIHS
ncbi:MAG: hypothetical protein U0525_00405 [Patescibacteria group bacterium]